MIATSIYAQVEAKQRAGHNRICINGSITGCGKCVGYCQYQGHPGYLTAQLRKEHKCLEKECFYYVPKPTRERAQHKDSAFLDMLLSSAIQRSVEMEGLRVMSVHEQGENSWLFNYVTISDEYPIHELVHGLECDFHGAVTFKKLNYSFERCVQLILAG